MTTARSILQRFFGYRAFRGQQAEIVDHVVRGGSALVLAPTGGGKSLCYQIPALMKPGTAVVISPLIALMQDQVAALRDTWASAAVLNSTLTAEMAGIVERNFVRGEYDLLYVSPERLLTTNFLNLLDEVVARDGLSLFAIDEAHCVSQWGHDFRPAYMGLSVLAERYPHVPRMALTATADTTTRAEMVEKLGLADAREFISSFDRPNIRYLIAERRDARAKLLDFLRREHDGHAGIVYCLSRQKVEDTVAYLTNRGIRALPYHAGMGMKARNENQDMFLREDDLVMVATIAFGMGIDKPNIRFVAHLGLPKSVENYYQETGRAGRDGLPADAWMAYAPYDIVQHRNMIEDSSAGECYKHASKARLDALLGLCETTACRRVSLLTYFDEQGQPCGNCDNCLDPPQTWNGTKVVRALLECVSRTGQRFGTGHIIDVLTGKDTAEVQRYRHHKLPDLFGVGAETTEVEWRSIIRQAVAYRLLAVDYVQDKLCLTTSGRTVLKSEQRVALRKQRQTKCAHKAASHQVIREPDINGALWEQLRVWRSEMARSCKVPTYRILDDRVLLQIAFKKPRSLNALGQVAGVGALKLETYGKALLKILLAPRESGC